MHSCYHNLAKQIIKFKLIFLGDSLSEYSRRATGFHRWTKPLELNFFVRKTGQMVKPAGKIVLTASQPAH